MDLQGLWLCLSFYFVLRRVLDLVMVGERALIGPTPATIRSHLATEIVAQVALRAENSSAIYLLR